MLKQGLKKGRPVLTGALPKGELAWVFVTGDGRENYNRDGYVYTASIIWDEETGNKVIKQITEFYKSVKVEKKSQQGTLGFTFGVRIGDNDETFVKSDDIAEMESDDTDFEKTGRVQMQFQTNREFNGKRTVVPIYNSKAKRVDLPEGTSIGNGSMGSLQVTIMHGTNERKQFLSRYLNGVQVTKLVEYTGANDFEAEDDDDDGWTGEEDSGFTDYSESSGSEDDSDDEIPM